MKRRRASAYEAGSWSGTRNPCPPVPYGHRQGAHSAATTGVPAAWASMATSPNDSLYDGMTSTDAARNQSRAGPVPTGGTNRTRLAMPSRAASFCSFSGFARPLPLAAHHRHDHAATQRGVPVHQQPTARSSTSGAFSGWIRPANSGTKASCGSRSRPRAARPSLGRNQSRLTPGCTTAVRVGSAS